jgi:hypothetical protein
MKFRARNYLPVKTPIVNVKMCDFDDRTIDLWFSWLRNHPTAKRACRKYFKQEFRMLKAILHWYRDYGMLSETPPEPSPPSPANAPKTNVISFSEHKKPPCCG